MLDCVAISKTMGTAMTQDYLIKLRRLVASHFDLEELRTLCFDLGINYDDLRGEGNANKARELVAYFERRGRIPELVAKCAQQRPGDFWHPPPRMASSNLQYSQPVGKGLTALAALMQFPEVRAAVIAFRIDFGAACEQIETMSNYKYFHDLLHTWEFHCYNPIVQEAFRFPGDEIAIESLVDYELTFQQIVENLKEIAKKASFPKSWHCPSIPLMADYYP